MHHTTTLTATFPGWAIVQCGDYQPKEEAVIMLSPSGPQCPICREVLEIPK